MLEWKLKVFERNGRGKKDPKPTTGMEKDSFLFHCDLMLLLVIFFLCRYFSVRKWNLKSTLTGDWWSCFDKLLFISYNFCHCIRCPRPYIYVVSSSLVVWFFDPESIFFFSDLLNVVAKRNLYSLIESNLVDDEFRWVNS